MGFGFRNTANIKGVHNTHVGVSPAFRHTLGVLADLEIHFYNIRVDVTLVFLHINPLEKVGNLGKIKLTWRAT